MRPTVRDNVLLGQLERMTDIMNDEDCYTLGCLRILPEWSQARGQEFDVLMKKYETPLKEVCEADAYQPELQDHTDQWTPEEEVATQQRVMGHIAEIL